MKAQIYFVMTSHKDLGLMINVQFKYNVSVL